MNIGVDFKLICHYHVKFSYREDSYDVVSNRSNISSPGYGVKYIDTSIKL